MTEYIERELARQVICGWCEYDSCLADDYYWNKCDAKRRLDDIPSADVVRVVRCKECKHRQYDAIFGKSWCNGRLVTNDHFCAYGER